MFFFLGTPIIPKIDIVAMYKYLESKLCGKMFCLMTGGIVYF